ncbi:MAG TPA: putative cytokinetic ring protein SteA [Actinomycetota bacterium]|nr:putative cytokinetic ring protein SteA [Actinomycetota bacterium]
MGIRLLSRRSSAARRPLNGSGTGTGLSGTARMDRRTKDLVRRVKPGNIAIIDHDDLDRVAAESLLDHGVAAVVNARPSISGRYPNLGPLILVHAHIPVLDAVGPGVFDEVSEGDVVRLEGDKLLVDDRVVAQGVLLDEASVLQKMEAAKAQLSATVERFAENTLDYVRREQDILVEGVRIPLRTRFKGRHALVVTRGHHYKEDLRALRGYIKEMRPVIVAVDGAADACLAEGIKPDVIVGDVDSASAAALRSGAELLVHPQGEWRRRHAEGQASDEPEEVKTVRNLGLSCHVITAPGTSEDVALLLAHEQGAELVVAVGSHTSTIEFLDKGRAGMASTFLARLRLGPSLVDAKGVSLLYRTRVRRQDLLLLVVAAVVTMAIVNYFSPPARLFWGIVWEQLIDFVFRLRGLF